MQISCNIITREIKALAKQLGESEIFTCNLVTAWQASNNTLDYPTVGQVRSWVREKRIDESEIRYAIPFYTPQEHSDGNPMVFRDKDNNIILNKFAGSTIPSNFWTEFNIPELETLIGNNVKLAYTFLLWKEMALIRQFKGYNTPGYQKIAARVALEQLREYVRATGDGGKVTTNTPALKANPKEFTLYSGGATGADQFWGYSLRRLGVQVKDIKTQDYDNLSSDKKTAVEQSYTRVVAQLGRKELPVTTVGGKLVRRDMLQVENADSVLAVGTINTRNTVDGGTGYAVQEGINKGIPVYVYDLNRHSWMYWHPQSKSWRPTGVPQITKHAAVVGTRGSLVNGVHVFPEEGKQAIIQAVENTFLMQPSQQSVIQVSVSQPSSTLEKTKNYSKQRTIIGSWGSDVFLENLDQVNVPINYVSKESLKGRLATTKEENGEYSILVAEDFTLEEFFDYIQGLVASPTSAQKKKVFEELGNIGYSMEHLRQLITNVQEAREFLQLHEKSHLFHRDKGFYWIQGEDFMTPDKIAIELNATLDAWRFIEQKHLPKALRESLQHIRQYQGWQAQHLSKSPNFKKDHRYLYDGNPISYSVTGLRDIIWPKNVPGDHSYSTAIGDSVDALTRDFFEGKDLSKINYPNLSEERKAAIIEDCKRLKDELTHRYGKNAQIITSEFILGGKIQFQSKEVSVAGTMDMLVIDEHGLVHILDMKTKKDQTIEQWDNRRDYEFQLNAYRQLLEAIMPELADKIVSLDLIWFDQSYPTQGSGANYITNENTGIVTVTTPTQSNIRLENFEEWVTPHLKPNVADSLINLGMQNPLDSPKPLDDKWNTTPIVSQTPTENVPITTSTPRTNSGTQAQYIIEANPDGTPKIGRQNFSLPEDSPRLELVKEFSPQQRKYRVEMIAREFSRILARQVKSWVKDNPGFADMDEIAQKRGFMNNIGLVPVIDALKQRFQEIVNMSDERLTKEYGTKAAYVKDAYQKVLDNFEALMEEVAIELERTEPIRFVFGKTQYNRGNGTQEVDGGWINQSTTDAQNNEDQFGDDPEGRRATGNDGWAFQAKFVEPHQTLTKAVKALLRNIKRVDAKGNVEKDDLGNIRYIPERYAYASLLAELAYVIDVDDFVIKNGDGSYSYPALENLQQIPQYAWVGQLLKAFKKNPEVASQFFRNFRKDATAYWTQKWDPEANDNKGAWKTFPLNEFTAEDSATTSIVRNFSNLLPQHSDSIFDNFGNLSKENAQKGIAIVDQVLSNLIYFDPNTASDVISKTTEILQMLGFSADAVSIQKVLGSTENPEENGIANLEVILQSAKRIFTAIATGKHKGGDLPTNLNDKYVNYFSSGDFANRGLGTIAKLAGIVSENNLVQMFRLEDKDYPTYTAPDYSNKLFRNLLRDDRRHDYIERHFKQDSWFYDNEEWSSEWLRIFEDDSEDSQEIRAHVRVFDVPAMAGSMYEDWDPFIIRTSFIRQYFAPGINPGSEIQYGDYNFPIFSDSTMARFIRFRRYVDNPTKQVTFKQQLLPLFRKIVLQELRRIKRVEDREKSGVTPISNYDKNGGKFFFFPALNGIVFDDGKTFLGVCKDLRDDNDLKGLYNFIDGVLSKTGTLDGSNGILDDMFDDFYNKMSSEELKSLSEHLITEGIISSPEELKGALEEYFWNHHYAMSQIIQLTTTDLAFYKDDNGVDFQKRFKEVYASGERLNTKSKYGKDIERTIILKDQEITSGVYTGIKTALDKAVAEGRLLDMDRDAILQKFRKVNVTDGQAFRSLKSLRTVLDMKGDWTKEMENAFQRFQEGKWDMSDFNLVWQTIKPYVFTNIMVPDGLGGWMRKPEQHKDSEFLLLSMYQLIAASTAESGKIRALNEFMDANDIDVVLFESAVKVGGQGPINLSYSIDKLEDWVQDNPKEFEEIKEASGLGDSASLYEIFKKGNDTLLHNGAITQEVYNSRFNNIDFDYEDTRAKLEKSVRGEDGKFRPDVVHEIPYEDYCIQQPTPEHLFDVVDAVFGSQFRNLLISDLPDDSNFRITVNGREYSKAEIIRLYQSLITENLLESFGKVESQFADIRKLQSFLKDQISGNPKYGRDMLDALEIIEITDENGETREVFNLPFNCPTITAKIQELLLSRFKNAIAKQTINGGNAILVSNFGFTEKLKPEYGPNGEIIAMPCYLPAYSKKFFEGYLIEKTNDRGLTYWELDFESLSKEHPELLKAVGYRIPTEDKYSMIPLKIVGFLPQQNGSSIMLPADITTLSGSDFDIDKLFLMLPSFRKIDYNMAAARRDYAKVEQAAGKQKDLKEDASETAKQRKENLDEIGSAVNSFMEGLFGERADTVDIKGFNDWFEDNKENYRLDKPILRKYELDLEEGIEHSSKEERDNLIIDIAYAILTHPAVADKIQNPGSFDKLKTAARTATILSDADLIREYAEEKGIAITNPESIAKSILKSGRKDSFKALDDFTSKHAKSRSPLSLDTFIFNHEQNMAGASLIGMYANNNTSQAKHQGIPMAIKGTPLRINGRSISSLTDSYNEHPEYWDRISKNCAEFLAGAVDNGKDPNLAALLQNKVTANIMGTMLRAGLTIEEAGLLFSHPVIRDAILKGKVSSFKVFSKFINDTLGTDVGKLVGAIPSPEALINFDFSSEQITTNIVKNKLSSTEEDGEVSEERKKLLVENLRIASLFGKFLHISEYLGELTRCTRADSPNGAVAITIAEAETQRRRLEVLRRKALMPDCPIAGLSNIIENGVLSLSMTKAQKREALLHSRQPMLQGFYSLGIDLAVETVGKYFISSSPQLSPLVERMHDTSASGILPEKILNAFYLDAFKYYMSKSPLFGGDGTYEQKRHYYLTEFPKEFIRVVQKNKDLDNIGIVRKLIVKNGEIILDRSSKIDGPTVESLMRDLDLMMLDSDNPEAQQLAMDLFAYCYYRDGLQFGPENFGRFFSTIFITHIPAFIDAARKMQNDPGVNWENFVEQFYMYHGLNKGVVPRISDNEKDIDLGDGLISMLNKKCKNANVLDGRSYEYINYYNYETQTGGLYKLKHQGATDSIYEPVTTIRTKSGKRYDASRTAEELADEYKEEQRVARERAETAARKSEQERKARAEEYMARQQRQNANRGAHIDMTVFPKVVEQADPVRDAPAGILNADSEGSPVPPNEVLNIDGGSSAGIEDMTDEEYRKVMAVLGEVHAKELEERDAAENASTILEEQYPEELNELDTQMCKKPQ